MRLGWLGRLRPRLVSIIGCCSPACKQHPVSCSEPSLVSSPDQDWPGTWNLIKVNLEPDQGWPGAWLTWGRQEPRSELPTGCGLCSSIKCFFCSGRCNKVLESNWSEIHRWRLVLLLLLPDLVIVMPPHPQDISCTVWGLNKFTEIGGLESTSWLSADGIGRRKQLPSTQAMTPSLW